ncbi:MAG: hypothetical protein COA74_15020 [Gammaproteobacteria bacterium]|nr:MAG: hypothetical protein COA74_15020 [Gammaproteobacteria bacterium]
MTESAALISNDAIVLGIIALMLGLVFKTSTSEHKMLKAFYRYVPALLLCYFLPSLLNTFNIIDGDKSQLYYVASRYLLPASLVLLTLSVDFKRIFALGPKALIMFLTGTLGIVIGGPIAIMLVALVSPETVGGNGPDAVWRGMTTIAGSWIGGGANQVAMKETYEVGNDMFSVMVTIDIIVASIWMAVLLIMASRAKQLDEKNGANTDALDELKETVEAFQRKHSRIPQLPDFMYILAIAFGVTGFAHLVSDNLAPWIGTNYPVLADYSLASKFFWMIIVATTGGLMLSFTKARTMESVGASKVGSAFIYVLVASIGMKMNILAIFEHYELFIVGIIWMLVHASLILIVAKAIKAPTFYMAVGSQANVGGAASAPIVAAAFHPSLAPVGVLLAVLGYTIGSAAAWFCGQLMRLVAPM